MNEYFLFKLVIYSMDDSTNQDTFQSLLNGSKAILNIEYWSFEGKLDSSEISKNLLEPTLVSEMNNKSK